ncbi:MAG: ABC transporter substrate-binding protein, partial [Clostridia bacterium]
SCGISKSFKKIFENLGGEIYQEKFFNSSDVDFSSLITSFDINKTDAFFVPAYYDQGGVIIKQMRKFGINKPILSGDSFDSPALQEITGKNEYLTNVFFTNHTCFSEERKNINTEKFYFENEYLKKYKIQPAAYCALGYDSLMIFAKGYKNALLKESLPSKDNIINGIKSIKNQEFATGKISIDEKGNAIKTPVFVTFENGKQKQIILNSN